MTISHRSARPAGHQHSAPRAVARGIAAGALALGILLGSATSAGASPAQGHFGDLPLSGHAHKMPDCWLCIM